MTDRSTPSSDEQASSASNADRATDPTPADADRATDPDAESTADRRSTADPDGLSPSTVDAADDPDPGALFDERPDSAGAASDDPASDLGRSADRSRSPDAGDFVEKLYWAGLGVAVLFGAFALFRFYASVSAAIDLWVAPEVEPILQAAFHLVVLLAAGIVGSLLVRRLRSRPS